MTTTQTGKIFFSSFSITENFNGILWPAPNKILQTSPKAKISTIPVAYKTRTRVPQKYLEKAKSCGLAWWIIDVLFSKAKQHLELFACYMALCILHKYCYRLQNQIACCQYTHSAIKHTPTSKPDSIYKTWVWKDKLVLWNMQLTLFSSFWFQLAILRQKLNTRKYTYSVLEMSGEAHRHEPCHRNADRKRKNHSGTRTQHELLSFPYDHEAVINSEMHLEDI